MSDGSIEQHAVTQENFQDQFLKVVRSLPGRPVVTILIIAANIGVFGWMVATGVNPLAPNGQAILEWGANYPPLTLNGQWWRILSSMFLHFGLLHLAMNMFVLWGLGQPAERFVGSAGLAIAYLASGVCGGLASLAWNPAGISAGASGAVFGTAGVLLGFVMRRSDTIPAQIRTKVLSSMARFLLLNTVIGLSVARIDMAAHIGGFVGGTLCGLVLSQPLTPGLLARRSSHNLVLALAAVLLLPAAFLTLPKPEPDAMQLIQQLLESDSTVRAQFRMLWDQAVLDNRPDAELADQIERTIIPAWQHLSQKTDDLKSVKPENQEHFAKIISYLKYQEEVTRLIVVSLRESDPAKQQEARKQAEQGAQVLLQTAEK